MAGLEANVLFSEGMMVLKIRNNLSKRRNRLMKRIFDLVCVLTGGLLILPVIAVISVLVAIDNRGNIIFAHKRVGKDGKMFSCYKFQTMIPNAQEKLEEYLKKILKQEKNGKKALSLQMTRGLPGWELSLEKQALMNCHS